MQTEIKNNTDILRQWQQEKLPVLKEMLNTTSQIKNVTAVAHWFWNDERFETDFFSIEFSLRITRYFIGNLPITFIVNKPSILVENLAKELNLKVIIDKTLTNGLKSLNQEYIKNLHTYFETEYCLTIQNDGFPLRQGLEYFTGKADYIGAPWPANGDNWITRILLKPNTRVGNGGFSLRSKQICEAASRLYKRKYKVLPFCYLVVDDFFYCRVLPTYENKYAEQFKFADLKLAYEFSIEYDTNSLTVEATPPLGIHGTTGFQTLKKLKFLPKFG